MLEDFLKRFYGLTVREVDALPASDAQPICEHFARFAKMRGYIDRVKAATDAEKAREILREAERDADIKNAEYYSLYHITNAHIFKNLIKGV